ncbi:unnamed protein product [Scytosiphon promiscuus]
MCTPSSCLAPPSSSDATPGSARMEHSCRSITLAAIAKDSRGTWTVHTHDTGREQISLGYSTSSSSSGQPVNRGSSCPRRAARRGSRSTPAGSRNSQEMLEVREGEHSNPTSYH